MDSGPGQLAPGGLRRLSGQHGVFAAQVVATFDAGGAAYTRCRSFRRGPVASGTNNVRGSP
eukprot:16431624-Heterocapsa_arctica.AAC.1